MTNDYVFPLPDGFLPGSRAIIKGIPVVETPEKVFGVSLLTKPPWIGKGVCVFQADFHYEAGHLETGEKRYRGMPIYAGNPFQIVIVCEATYFSLHIDGNHFADFPHHAPLQTIECLKVAASVKVTSVSVDRIKFINWPLPNGFKPRDIVTIRGLAGTKTSSDEFVILFQNASSPSSSNKQPADYDIPLSMTVRFKKGDMVNNTYESQMWGKNQIHPKLPLSLGYEFEIAVSNKETYFKVFVGEKKFCKYDMRVPWDKIGCLMIRDNVDISSVVLTSKGVQPKIS